MYYKYLVQKCTVLDIKMIGNNMKLPMPLEEYLNACSTGFFAADQTGNLLFVNRRCLKIFQLSKGPESPRTAGDINLALGTLVKRCLSNEKHLIGERLKFDGQEIIVNCSPVFEKGAVKGVVCTLTKLSEVDWLVDKLASLKKQITLLRTIFNASSDGLWLIDSTGTAIDANPACASIAGIDKEEIIGKNIFETEFKTLPKKNKEYVRQAMKTKKVARSTDYDGKKNTISTATPVLDEAGNLLWVVGNERDLTELNELKEQLVHAKEISEKYKEELSEQNYRELSDSPIVAESKSMHNTMQMALKLSHMGVSPIMITGESGTGKGFLAKFIHHNNPRGHHPLVQINCAALPETLLEAELFGYEKGAFTGASDKGKIGLIEQAHKGTLFLDEIGDMPIGLQAKLLKYLDDYEVMRLGSVKSKKVDCCVISATNQDLNQLIKQKRFRQDLYFRLNTFEIRIPPLRERPDDVFEMINLFLKKYNREYNLQKRITATGLRLLQSYRWEGNVRELKNFLKRAVVMSMEDTIDSFLEEILAGDVCASDSPAEEKPSSPKGLNDEILATERRVLAQALSQYRTAREMAKHLKTSHATIVRKLHKHGLSR